MAKTRIQTEIAERKKKEKQEQRLARQENLKNREKFSFKKTITNLPKRVKILALGIGIIVLVVTVVMLLPSNDKIDSTGYNVDDRYTIDDNGKVVFLNGDEIIKAFPSSYKMSIKTSGPNGDNDYTVEAKDNTILYYGTENDKQFNEAHIWGDTYSLYLSKAGDSYNETDSLHYAYIDGLTVVKTILCGNDIENDEEKYTSSFIIDGINNIFVPETAETTETPEEMDEPEEIEYEIATASVYMEDGNIYISGESDKHSFEITIEKISKLSEDVNKYAPSEE